MSTLAFEGERIRQNGARPDDTTGADATETNRSRYVVTAAEQAECTCPEFCERDHEND